MRKWRCSAGIKASFRQIIREQALFSGLRLIQPAHTRLRPAGDKRTALPLCGAVSPNGRLKTDAEQRPQHVRGACPLSAVRPPAFYLISLRIESGGSFSEVDHDVLHLGIVLQDDLMGFAADA